VANGSETALLSECKVSHLVSSRVFLTNFEGPLQARDDDEGIRHFYIIEEYSLFSPTSEKIVNTQRKIKHFRKLSDFEVLLLLFKSLGHLIQTSTITQSVELKLSQECVKKMAQANPQENNLDMSFQSMIQSIQGEASRYLIVDCVKDNGQLVKQYLVRQMVQTPKPVGEPAFCQYPNCL